MKKRYILFHTFSTGDYKSIKLRLGFLLSLVAKVIFGSVFNKIIYLHQLNVKENTNMAKNNTIHVVLWDASFMYANHVLTQNMIRM